jgi:DNA-binding response OmpR family regulator
LPSSLPVRILILDSDVASWQFIRRTLSQAGYEAVAAATIAEARTLTLIADRGAAFSLAIVNVEISGGFDLATDLAAAGAGAKILYTALVANTVVLDSIARLTPDAVMPRPFSAVDLLARIERLLGEAQTRATSA